MKDANANASASGQPEIMEPTLWRKNGWTARVIKNEDDDGWAVEMIKDGEPEPALVGPWTMGRDKKNPKPLDAPACNTLVKTAYEVRRRHEQHQHALLNRRVVVRAGGDDIAVTLQIVPEEDDPYGVLTARPVLDAEPDAPPLGEARVAPSFKLSEASALAWIEGGYRMPR